MRRHFFAALLLLILFPALPQAHTQPQTQATESDRLRATARDLLRSNSPEDTARAADLTPVLTTLILAGTLLFNIRDRAQQRDADERKRYVEAIDVIGKSEQISPTASLISSFTQEPYRSEIRRVGKAALLQSKSYAAFQDLFRSVYDPIIPANFPSILTLLRSVNESLRPTITKAWTTGKEDLSALSSEERSQYQLFVAEQRFVSERIGDVLRGPHPALQPLDLSSLNFYGADFKGADLRGANLNYAGWSLIDVEGADFRGITSFLSFATYNTAWWLAAHIDPPLLNYLRTRCPYSEDDSFNTRQPTSRALYEQNLRRLQGSDAEAIITEPKATRPPS